MRSSFYYYLTTMLNLTYTFEKIRWGYVLLVLDDDGKIYYAAIGDKRANLLKSMLQDIRKCKDIRVRLLQESTEAIENSKIKYKSVSEDPRTIENFYKSSSVEFLFGTVLQKRVWRYLMENSKASKKLTYGDITRGLGMSKNMSRAVGNACGANRIALLVPCHRVTTMKGEISGYRWGGHIKRELLRLEET